MRCGSVRGKSRLRFHPSSKRSTDRPSASCMKPLSLPPPRSKQSTRWRQSSGSRTSASVRIGAGGQSTTAWLGGAGRSSPPSTRAYSSNGATSTTRSIRSRTTEARATPKALARPSPSRRNRIDGYRVSSVLHEAEIRIGDDSEEGGFDAFNDAPTGRESLERRIRQRIAAKPRKASAIVRPGTN